MATQKKIFIIDDNPIARKVLDKRLKEEGYDTIVVADPRETALLAAREQPDLIICDVNMPLMDGGEVAASLKRHSRETANIPIMFLTTLVTEDVNAYTSGEYMYVSKMSQAQELFAQIRKMLQIS
ncbi:MAG: two-component system response regulator [bacterium]